MKKMLTALLLMLTLLFTGCSTAFGAGNESAQNLNSFFIETAAGQTTAMHEKANSTAYIELVLGGDVNSEAEQLVSKIAAENFDNPTGAVIFRGNSTAFYSLLQQAMNKDYEEIPELPQEQLQMMENTLFSAFSSLIGMEYGTPTLLANNALANPMACPKPDNFNETTYVILKYENSWSSYTGFAESQQNTLLLTSQIFNEAQLNITERLVETVQSDEFVSFLEQNRWLGELTVEELSSEQIEAALSKSNG